MKNSITLTVLFEEQFWVGVFEKESSQGYSVARLVFGSEPTEAEVYDYLMNQCEQISFSAPSKEKALKIRRKSPKRVLRETKKAMQDQSALSKAYEVMRIELEKNKRESKKRNKLAREAEKQHQFELKQAKKKEKLKGH